jgi:zinc transport system substrate-binding protein
MFKRLTVLLLTLIITIPLLYGCKKENQNNEESTPDKLIVAVTILPQEAFVKAICGDLVNVITIVPPGSSPESYEPTAKQMEDFAKASIYFTIGVPVEQSKSLFKAEKKNLVKLEDSVSKAYPDLTLEGAGRDPHIWLSPKRAVVMVKTISEEMAKLDPDHAEVYSENALAYITQLEELDTTISNMFSYVQSDKKKFITFHPAYGYFAADYGLEMHSLETEGREATAKDLQDLIDFAKQNDLKVMFSQKESDSRQPEAFTQEVGGEVIMLDPLSGDYINNIKYIAEQIAGTMKWTVTME